MPALHSIMQELKNAGLSVDNLNLSLNIDGLPISKSSNNSFWPILISGNIFPDSKVCRKQIIPSVCYQLMLAKRLQI